MCEKKGEEFFWKESRLGKLIIDERIPIGRESPMDIMASKRRIEAWKHWQQNNVYSRRFLKMAALQSQRELQTHKR